MEQCLIIHTLKLVYNNNFNVTMTAGGKVVMWVLGGGIMMHMFGKYWLSNTVAFEVMCS